MAIREGRWDCGRCGLRGVRGRDVECPGCGGARGKEARFYLPEDAGALTDADLLARAAAGPDWICGHCQGSNRAARAACTQCGAPRGPGSRRPVRAHGAGEVPGRSEPPPEPLRPAPGRRRPRRFVRLGLGVGAALLVALLVFLAGSETVSGHVAEKSWERTIRMEAFRTVQEEDWSVPAGGRQVSTWRAVHHTARVLDGHRTVTRTRQEQTGTESYTCGSRDLGNGYFQDVTCTRPVYASVSYQEEEPVYRDEPVYRTKYRYEIERWVEDRTLRASEATDSAYWPAFTLAERERDGPRAETYRARFADENGRTYERTLPFEEWRTYRRGEAVVLRVGRAGDLREVRRAEGAPAPGR